MMKNNHTNQLDEMQDQKLLKLEEYGFWILFWALFASIVVQLFIGATFKEIAGEFIILLIGSVYLCITTLKNGIWTRQSTPTRKGNAVTSLIPAIMIGVLNVIRMLKNNRVNAASILTAAAIMAATYLACFVVLELFRDAYNKQRAKLDNTDDENEE